ncbi:MAG: hypothetical protein V1806_04855 [Pseudomonadota bacterium]
MTEAQPSLLQAGAEALKGAQELQTVLKKALQDPENPAKAQAVETALAKLRGKLGSEDSPPQATPAGLTFKGPNAVAAHLREEGWKVGKSAIYNHVKEGKLRPRADGLFDETAVLRYAQKHLKRADGSGSENLEALQAKKVRAEITRAEVQAAKMQLQQDILEGKFITRVEHERDLATRARLLKSDLFAWGRLYVEELVQTVNGDPARAPEALAFTERHIEDWLNRYASQGQIQLAAPEAKP